MAIITLKGSQFNTIGELPMVGTQAPDFTMTREDMTEVRLSDCHGKMTVLNIFPSLDTPTCAAAMKQFNKIAKQFPDAMILCISADLPFAQHRFCNIEHLQNVIPVSIFRNPGFGKNYGVQIMDGPLNGLLTRAVIVLDKESRVVHTELVEELANEPNYQAALDCITSQNAV